MSIRVCVFYISFPDSVVSYKFPVGQDEGPSNKTVCSTRLGIVRLNYCSSNFILPKGMDFDNISSLFLISGYPLLSHTFFGDILKKNKVKDSKRSCGYDFIRYDLEYEMLESTIVTNMDCLSKGLRSSGS